MQGGKNGSNVILKEHILPPSFVINFEGGINHANGVVTVAENNERRSDIGMPEHLDRQRDDTLDHLAFHKISAHRGINAVPCAAIGHNANRFAALCKKVAGSALKISPKRLPSTAPDTVLQDVPYNRNLRPDNAVSCQRDSWKNILSNLGVFLSSASRNTSPSRT